MDRHRCAALTGAFTAPPTDETRPADVKDLTVLPTPAASESDHQPPLGEFLHAHCGFFRSIQPHFPARAAHERRHTRARSSAIREPRRDRAHRVQGRQEFFGRLTTSAEARAKGGDAISLLPSRPGLRLVRGALQRALGPGLHLGEPLRDLPRLPLRLATPRPELAFVRLIACEAQDRFGNRGRAVLALSVLDGSAPARARAVVDLTVVREPFHGRPCTPDGGAECPACSSVGGSVARG